MNNKAFVRLRSALSVTLALCILVVFAGATVRATGSGMGCPDWPLCFGCLIPPFSVSQLPADFAEKYAVGGHPATFDAAKTWIEYLNRLLGVLAGVSLAVTTLFTAIVARRKPSLGVLALLSVLVLGFVAWLGAQVVGSFLADYTVTFHLAATYSLLALLLAQREIVGRVLDGRRPIAGRPLQAVLVALGLAFLLQWTLGIRVRDESEAWIWNRSLDNSVFNALGGAYDLHKLTAGLVATLALLLAWLGWRNGSRDRRLCLLTQMIAALVGVQALIGLILWFGGTPGWAKPFHLLAATGAWSFWVAAVFHSFFEGKS